MSRKSSYTYILEGDVRVVREDYIEMLEIIEGNNLSGRLIQKAIHPAQQVSESFIIPRRVSKKVMSHWVNGKKGR